jgi:hypothetical protein
MCTLRDTVIFIAGAEFFHTISHIVIKYFVALPLQINTMVMTTHMNNWAIIVNGIITILLLWWAARLKRKV